MLISINNITLIYLQVVGSPLFSSKHAFGNEEWVADGDGPTNYAILDVAVANDPFFEPKLCAEKKGKFVYHWNRLI